MNTVVHQLRRRHWLAGLGSVLIVGLIALTTGVAGASGGLAPESEAAQDNAIVESLSGRRPPAMQGVGGQARFGTARLLDAPGKPALPVERIMLLLPPDAVCGSVTVRVEEPVFAPVPGDWDVPPAPPVATSTKPGVAVWPAGAGIVNGRDQDVYGKDAYFPASPVLKVAADSMRQWRLVDFKLAPYRFNPVLKRLEVLVGGDLKVEFKREVLRAATPGSLGVVDAVVKDQAANFAEMAPAYGAAQADSPMPSANRYVIITTSAIQSASTQLDDLVADKEARGFTVQVITEGTWGGGTGNTAAENLRNWLKNNYAALNIQYVLLIGNPHPTTGTVPMKMCYPQVYDPAYSDCPTDFYYAELTGNWDLDSDGKYGEYIGDYGAGGCGTAWEVLVGRLPYYGSMTDLDAILAKIIAYSNQSAGDAAWRHKALLPMKPSDALTPGYQLGEAIKNSIVVPKGGWGYYRVYEQGYGLSPAPEATPCNADNTTNAWNAQHPGAVFWWTHGNETTAGDVMDLSHAATLNDSYPAFTFQCSCLNAHPETSNNLAYTLLKKGGVCTISGTRVTWYSQGQTSFAGTPTNSGMTYEYAKRLITNEVPAADALQGVKSSIAPGDDVWWMNYLDFNVYGCPAVGLYSYGGTPTAPAVISPNGGESWLVGSSQNITWTTGTGGAVSIELSRNNGSSWETLYASTTNDGSQPWTVSGTTTSQARVRIANANGSDSSNATFTITAAANDDDIPGVAIPPSPFTDSVVDPGDRHDVYRIVLNAGDAVTVSLSGDPGTDFDLYLFPPAATTVADPGQAVAWSLGVVYPETMNYVVPTSGSYYIDVYAYDGGGAYTLTYGVTGGAPAVISPNGGESWLVGSSQNITWTTGTGGAVSIELSRNNGSSWETLYASTTNDGSQPWTVSGTTTSQARVRIANANGSDSSNATFTITAAPSDTTPPTTTAGGHDAAWHNAAVTLSLSATDNAGGSGVKRIEYRVDAASSWTTGTSLTIAAPSSHANDGAHTVTYRSVDNADNTESDKSCQVKIDTTAPVTGMSRADDAWHNQDVHVNLTPVDAASGADRFEVSYDGGAWESFDVDDYVGVTVLASASHSNDGAHTVAYRGVDKAGNVETAKTCTVKIDTRQPTTQALRRASVQRGKRVKLSCKIVDQSPNGGTAQVKIRIKTSGGRTVRTLSLGSCSVNRLVSCLWSNCTLPKGKYRYFVYATDAAGNRQRSVGSNYLVVR